MRTWIAITGLALGMIGSADTRAQLADTTQWDFHGRVVSIYNFAPHRATLQQQKAKAAEMDTFWKDVKADPAVMLPLLRAELKDPASPRFFKQDGSALLLSMSHAPDDELAVAGALPQVDLADVTASAYFDMVHRLSIDGVDVTQAALHVLDSPDFKAKSLSRPMAMVFMLLPLEETKWVDAIVDQFTKAKKDETKITLLTVLFFAQMPQADAVISSTAHDGSQSQKVQAEAQRWVQTAADARKAKYKIKGKEDEIRAARRESAKTVSDRSLDEISMLTGRLVQLRKK